MAWSFTATLDSAAETCLLVHVGYQKTGSSWLQREIFGMPRGWDAGPSDVRLLGAPLPADIDFTREDRSLSPAAVAVKRLLNLMIIPVDIDAFPQPKINASLLSLMKRDHRALPSSSSGIPERRMKADVKAIIGSMFAKSNRITSGLIESTWPRSTTKVAEADS